MATAPRINLPDGSGTTVDFVITSNLFSFVFTGVVDSNTIDIQIDINGAGFVSDPSLIDLAVPNFTVPNLSSFPNGIELQRGLNILQLRAIDISGAVSPATKITVTVVTDADLAFIPPQPTGVSISRRADSIDLIWTFSDAEQVGSITAGNTNLPISGYNIYASTGPGGTDSGFLRVNKDLIPSNNPKTSVEQEFGPIEYVFDIEDDNSNSLRITADVVNPYTGEFVQRVAVSTFSFVQTQKLRYDLTVSDLFLTKTYNFNHNRLNGLTVGILNSDIWAPIDPENPLYYVITSVIFNAQSGLYLESNYSQELTGGPLPQDRTIRGIRIRDQRLIATDYIREVQFAAPTLAIIPGSTIREVHIEPFSNEMQKAYFLMDFVHRSKSFAALLAIDDPGHTGTSVPVQNSQYKQALRSALSIQDDSAVQQLINGAFDSLAANFGKVRQGRRPSIVVQTFYTTTRPTGDLVIQQGAIVASSTDSAAPRFRANGSTLISGTNPEAYYNSEKGRYEVSLQMVADTPGSVGNISANTLNVIVSGAGGLQTINEVAADFGQDEQSNLALSEDGTRAILGVDTGTTGGYKVTAIGTPGVLEVRIIEAGNAYMMRDWDPIRMKHIGGKVDIFIKGTIERTVLETFAFQFSTARAVRFDCIDTTNLIFRARDSRLTPDNPIDEMLNNQAAGFGLRNDSLTPTQYYDLTGVQITDYRTIQLNTLIAQPPTNADDFVDGDYRFRSNNKFTASVQPIRRVVSVVGEISGALDSDTGFKLFKVQDPLLEGESTRSTDYVEIFQVDDVPSGDSIAVNDEQHILIGQIEEPLQSVGINTFTVKVFNQDRSHQFNGPETSNPDFLIVGGSQTTPISIERTTSSAIISGDTVSVDYEHDENFTVTYVVNDVLQKVQDRIQITRHATADVLVKQAIENPLLIEGTVQLASNADQATTDQAVRTNYTIMVDKKGVGGDTHVSDVVAVIDDSNGVDFVVQPFAKFTLQNGAIRVRDVIPSEATELASLNKFANKVWTLVDALPFNTINTGGTDQIHHGVYKDELIMTEVLDLSSIADLPNQSYIIGKDGAVIQGYSDDATLTAAGFITPEDILAERLKLTANHVVISLDIGINPPDDPSLHTFAATYIVEDDVGPRDIEISEIEYLTPGSLTLTYRKAT